MDSQRLGDRQTDRQTFFYFYRGGLPYLALIEISDYAIAVGNDKEKL